MNSEDNPIPFEKIESDMMKELYKKTPLKKRPIQPSSLSPDEKKPRACTVPEGRLSKRKMLKPTKKLIESYVQSTPVLEQATKAMYVPEIKTSTESITLTPVEMKDKAVDMAMAMAIPIPELKKTDVKIVVRTRSTRFSWHLYFQSLTEQEKIDFFLALQLLKEEFNLRVRRPIRILSPEIRVRYKRRKSNKTKRTSTGSMDSDSISSPKMKKGTAAKQPKKEVKRMPKKEVKAMPKKEVKAMPKREVKAMPKREVKAMPKREVKAMPKKEVKAMPKKEVKAMPKKAAETIRKNNMDAFSGSHMYTLSPELANIVGNEKMAAGAIIDAMHYVFLERNLFEEPDKKYVICDDELSEKIFAGKRRLRFDDVKNYLHKHLTLSD